MNVLVTGGLGFIGSHTAVELIKAGHNVIIVDNLSNSRIETLDRIVEITGVRPDFYQADAADKENMKVILNWHSIDALMHFAGLKSVCESIENPIAYYRNNLDSILTCTELCISNGCKKIILSSSATVYGAQKSPMIEEYPMGDITNPYGMTKAMSEIILKDVSESKDVNIVILRYFNPIGAHESGIIGEDFHGRPTNLMPIIIKTALGEIESLNVYGDDYDTADGTAIRDFIHVKDLAKGHIKALEYEGDRYEVFNLGTGRGTSVLELIDTFKRVNNVDVPYRIADRRPGDIDVSFASAERAERLMGWKTEMSLEDMVRDSWNHALKTIEFSREIEG